MSEISVRAWRDAASEMSGSNGIEQLSAREARRPLEVARTRLLVAGAIFAICFVILGARLVQLSLLDGDHNTTQNARHDAALMTLQRADIVDRNGVLLATTTSSPMLTAPLNTRPIAILPR